jgi:hypothetical protein
VAGATDRIRTRRAATTVLRHRRDRAVVAVLAAGHHRPTGMTPTDMSLRARHKEERLKGCKGLHFCIAKAGRLSAIVTNVRSDNRLPIWS